MANNTNKGNEMEQRLRSSGTGFETMADVLRKMAADSPGKKVFEFIHYDQGLAFQSEIMTCGELDKHARKVAAQMQKHNPVGARAVLFYPPGFEFMKAFYGCLYAGAIPVPVNCSFSGSHVARTQSICEDSEPAFFMTDQETHTTIARDSDEIRQAIQKTVLLLSDQVDPALASDYREVRIAGDETAFLQYTSGSTAAPKGVMITHKNLFYNQEILKNRWQVSPSTSCQVSWLPHHHITGLVCNILLPVYVGGFRTILMSPEAFAGKPFRWIKCLSDYGARLTGAPNFAFDLAAENITEEDKKDINLEKLEITYNIAEPVKSNTLSFFYETYKNCGLKRESHFPMFGLSEATLFVSGGFVHEESCLPKTVLERLENDPLQEQTADNRCSNTPVSVGRSQPEVEIAIVDPETLTVRGSDVVGEIWVHAESVAKGYWKKTKATVDTFQGKTNEAPDKPYLRTGDLGFIHNEELFVTGRIKDLIIIRGINYFPTDIEQTVETRCDEVKTNCGAAFSIDADEGEKLMLACEIDPDRRRDNYSEVFDRIRQAVLEHHDLHVHGILLLESGTIPKTASGKIKRIPCRQLYLEGSLEKIAESIQAKALRKSFGFDFPLDEFLARSAGEKKDLLIKSFLKSLTGYSKDSDLQHLSLISLGFDSIDLNYLKEVTEEKFGITMEVPVFFRSDFTVEKFADRIIELAEQTGDGGTNPLLTRNRAAADEPFDLTDLQNAYWIGRNPVFELGNVSSHVYFEVDTDGDELAYDKLNQAWRELIQRHEMLRMVMLPDGRQRILKDPPDYTIEYRDLRSKSEQEKTEVLANIRRERGHRKIDTEQWPLFEIHFSRIDEQKSRIHVSIDLLIADVWSINLLMKEWAKRYRGQDQALDSAGISFRDYVCHLQEMRKTLKYKRSQNYWSDRISKLPPSPQLPLNTSLAKITDSVFKNRTFILGKDRWNLLRKRTLSYGITPSNLLLAAYCKVLASWSKTDDYALNLTLFNRPNLHADIYSIVGDFTSVIILEVREANQGTFIDFANRLQTQLAMDLENSDFNGIEVIQAIQKSNQKGSSALMPVVFTSALALEGGLGASRPAFFGDRVYKITQTPQVFLDNQIYEENGELVISWDSIDSLLREGVVDEMFEAYTSLITQLTEDETIWSGTTRSLISPGQLQKRQAYNDTREVFEQELLHEGFLQNARSNPQHPAVITSDRVISYGSLLAAAVKIAVFLQQQVVEPDRVVAIHMRKGWEQVAAVMGILVAGAAYVNIEPDLPDQRKQHLIENSSPQAVLTAAGTGCETFVKDATPTLAIDTSFLVEDEEATVPDSVQSENNLAYLIYTSGSTGSPKGVMITHRSAYNTIVDLNAKIGLTSGDRILALSSLSFDLSVYDIFGALKAGAGIVIPDAGTERNPEHWAELMQEQRVSVWNSVPALMEMLVEATDESRIHDRSQLRTVLLSGDWIPPSLPARIADLFPNADVIGLGGATEAAIWSIYHPIPSTASPEKKIPYGKPLANQNMFVFNSQYGDCPDQVQGDIYIGGAGLALGYLNDPEKTEKAFVIHPQTGERIYKTGDIGYFSPDGNIQFVGREDFQVKIGGFRVELGEIESILRRQPEVEKIAVRKEVGSDGNESLSAYLTLYAADSAGETPAEYDYDMEIESETDTDLLTQSNDRLLFKLRQPGIRQVGGTSIALNKDETSNGERYGKRSTSRRFKPEPIAYDAFSRLLASLSQTEIEGLTKYRYASAGGLYPVQVYVQIKDERVTDVPMGFYYYHPAEHTLKVVTPDAELQKEVHVRANQSVYDSSAFSLFLVGDLDAIEPMYGVKSRDFCLIEAGLISQLLESTATDLDIGLCQIGAFQEESPIRKKLALTDKQLLLHAMEVGKVDHCDPLRSQPLSVGSSQVLVNTALHRIKQYAKDRLPHYMIPGNWSVVEKMPLSPTGKVDYGRLPLIKSLKRMEQNSNGAATKPANELEEMIAQVFRQLVQVENPDTETSFFEIGADSLTIVKAWREITGFTGIHFSVVEMFAQETIQKLAEFMGALEEHPQGSGQRQSDSGDRKKDALRNLRHKRKGA